MPEYRAHFDAVVEFINGGSLRTERFRLDLGGGETNADEVGRLLVQHLGLALVARVLVTSLSVVEEQHRGSGRVDRAQLTGPRRVIDLSHTIRDGLMTYPGLPAPVVTPHLTR